MTRSTAAAIRIAGVLVAILIVLGLAGPGVAQLIRHTEVTEHPLAADLDRLTVHADVGEIRIRAMAPGEEPGAVATSRSSFTDPTVTVAQNGGATTLRSDCRGPGWIDPCEVEWDVLVPAGADVDLRTSVGQLRVVGVSGVVRAQTNVGDVILTDSGSPDVDVRSSVGEIFVTSLVAPDSVQGRTSTGDVRLTLPGDGAAYRVDTDTSIGETHNRVGDERGASKVITLSTSVGDIFIHRD
ncbi:DUF4097 family beta strand repeat-containing protein [Ornithinicoccus hortensis]|uniref:Putative adhesin n=1 Tax=Ornithinicoccus hortensis TaxID=82346 RepID=A0A542YNV9_9MICO|nr:DUF4097 family beta strand repeat-containing protein [Ornithinicoccus hortensis]TQL49737.1 putative adhesin [Ornithinicoccus hortensis]